MKLRNRVLLTIALSALLLPALARAQDTDTGQISVTIQNQAITLNNDSALSFGTILPFGRPGTATVAPSGAETQSNVFISQAGDSAGWSVTGVPNAPYAITLPSTPVVVSNGTNSMNVDSFTRTGGTNDILLDGAGKSSFKVGATLHVGANQPAGAYLGTYSVTVAYN
jgi:hypothetical protein